jgi:solute carrier family 25 aspartate/glutamate transporter 12/13
MIGTDSAEIVSVEMDQVERIIRDATAKSKDGRITAADFLNEAAHSLRYGIFTPMEANIIWHFASRGSGDSSMRLANVDFDALLDPKVSLGFQGNIVNFS